MGGGRRGRLSYGLRPAYSRGGAAGRGHGGCGGSFGFSVGGGHRGAGGAVGQLHGRLRPAPGAFVVRPFRGLRGARGASAVLHHLRRGAHRVRGAGAGELPRALPGGVEAPAGRRAPGRSGRRGQGGWCGIIRAGGGGISGPHAPGAAGVFGLGVRHAAGGPHGVRLHDGGAEVHPVRRGEHGAARLRAGGRGGAAQLPSAHEPAAHHAHLPDARAGVRLGAHRAEQLPRHHDADVLRRVAHLRVLRGRGHPRPGEPGGRGPCPGVLGRLGVRHGGGGLRAVLASGPGVRAHRPLPGRGRRPGALGGEHVLLRGRHRGGALGLLARGSARPTTGWARGMPARGPTRRPKACRRAARPWPTRPA